MVEAHWTDDHNPEGFCIHRPHQVQVGTLLLKNPVILFRILTVIFSPQIVEEHCSVEQSRRAQAEPISLDSCLKAFTSEEELGEDELYYCSKCKAHRLATKKLDLWRLPPVLVSCT